MFNSKYFNELWNIEKSILLILCILEMFRKNNTGWLDWIHTWLVIINIKFKFKLKFVEKIL